MPAPQTITTTIIKQIKELRALEVPYARVARKLGVSVETVKRYSSPEYEEKIKAYQRRRYEKEMANPEVQERRREYRRQYAERRKELNRKECSDQNDSQR